jgi:hypothetical protein
MARRIEPGLPMDWRLLASGYLDRYLYDLGALAGNEDFFAHRLKAHITDKAKAENTSKDFSERIRR